MKPEPREAENRRSSGGVLERWWAQLVITGWVLLVLLVYFCRQLPLLPTDAQIGLALVVLLVYFLPLLVYFLWQLLRLLEIAQGR